MKICAKFKENPSKRSWDIVFIRQMYVHQADRKPENTPPPPVHIIEGCHIKTYNGFRIRTFNSWRKTVGSVSGHFTLRETVYIPSCTGNEERRGVWAESVTCVVVSDGGWFGLSWSADDGSNNGGEDLKGLRDAANLRPLGWGKEVEKDGENGSVLCGRPTAVGRAGSWFTSD